MEKTSLQQIFCNCYHLGMRLHFNPDWLLQHLGRCLGSANQLLSALVLITLCVFLRVTGRENRTLLVPLVVMLCVTFTALVERCIALVKWLTMPELLSLW